MQDLPGRNEDAGAHSDIIERVVHVPEVDKYITCSRDATFRIWNSDDFKHNRTLVNGLRWVNDAVYIPNQRKLVVSSMDRSLTWYDVNRASYECIGRCV
jgi:WD40 repeat protein